MRHRQGHISKLGALSAIALFAGAAAPATKADVSVTITDLRSVKGVVMVCMTTDPGRFPKCRGDASAFRKTVPAAKSVALTFSDVAPGTYAIAVLHDENGNGKADRALGMMPTEGFGFSRDAKVRMGPPKFDEAAFTVGQSDLRQSIRMRYLL